jgi:hypothetical protein
MESSPELTRYAAWAGVLAFGALLAVFDWRRIRGPLFAVLLVAGFVGGLVIMRLYPFSFAGGHYMEGVLLSGGSALAGVGYASASGWLLVRRWLGRRGTRS